MSSLIAVTRGVSPQMAMCQLTHQSRVPIDVARAAAQHAAYEQALEQLGCVVHRLPAGVDMPDSVFIEDTAVVLDEVAIITRPGAVRRRRETSDVAKALERYRPVVRIDAPGSMDGGDVMVVGRRIFVGGHRQPQLHPAHPAPIPHVHLAELTRRRWWRRGRGERAQQGDP